MTAFSELVDLAARNGLEFIVCGGHAVNAYQVIRKTGDIDLVVRESEVARWKEQLAAHGYSVFHEDRAFLQLQPSAPAAWPVDLLVVDERTFATLKGAARAFRFGGAECLIPCIEHLIAMKLHALKFAGERRMRKDAVDIVELAESQGIDLHGEEFRALCGRFADESVYRRILVYAGKA